MARRPASRAVRPVLVTETARESRKLRRPQHRWQLIQRPWLISPFMIAPVLPGETLRNLLLQVRVASQPIRNPRVGWWAEYYVFYVRHRDLNIRDDAQRMVLDPTYDINTDHGEPAISAFYHSGTGINWARHCLERVVECYFRDTEEAYLAGEYAPGGVPSGLPLASIFTEGWWDSLHSDADHVEHDVDIEVGVDDIVTTSEIERAMMQWQLLRDHGLTEMTYEDYLRAYGVRAPLAREEYKPELIRYVREWNYPSVTVDPATNTPKAAMTWAIAERADKDRYFAEPGFIFGVTVKRPKVYLGGLDGSAVDAMTNAFTWLPPNMVADFNHTLRKFTPGEGPIPTAATDYWFDVKDLLLYGDQFVNMTEATAGYNFVALPTTTLQKRYASQTDMENLFSSAASNFLQEDGVANLAIAGRQVDTSPST